MLNPIEFSGVVQRTQDISAIKQNEDTRPQVEYVTVQKQETQKAILKHEQVNKKDNADKERNHFDAKEKGNGMYYESGGKKQKQKQNRDEGSVTKLTTSTFDIKA